MSEINKKCLEIAAQCWCDEETSMIEMDSRLAKAFAKRLESEQVKVNKLVEVLNSIDQYLCEHIIDPCGYSPQKETIDDLIIAVEANSDDNELLLVDVRQTLKEVGEM